MGGDMRKTTSYTVDKVLKNIDAFIEGRPEQVSDIQPYNTLIAEKPFTSGKFKAKVANRLVFAPIKIAKRSFSGYFHQRDKELMLTQQKLDDIEDKLAYLQETVNKLVENTVQKNTEHQSKSKG